MDTTPHDERALRAAAFLHQALELDATIDVAALASDLAVLKRDPHAAIFAAELESSVGPAAFLIYVYAFDAIAPDGRDGRATFDADLAVLETAAVREAPGPRLVAHALGASEGYLLATTPATLRALGGEPDPTLTESIEAWPVDLLSTGDVALARRNAAEALLKQLRAANTEAARWLAALQADGRLAPTAAETAETAETIPFNDAETELALYLLDDRSIQALLRAVNLLLTAARSGVPAATEASDGEREAT